MTKRTLLGPLMPSSNTILEPMTARILADKPVDVTGIKDTEQLRFPKAGLLDIVSLRMSQIVTWLPQTMSGV